MYFNELSVINCFWNNSHFEKYTQNTSKPLTKTSINKSNNPNITRDEINKSIWSGKGENISFFENISF